MSGSPTLPRITGLTIPTPFKVGPVNVYLVHGEPLTLVDAGPRTDDAWAALTAGLHEHGYRASDIERVVLTHAHLDHYGLLNRVVSESGATVYAHPRSVWWLTDTPGEWARRGAFFRAFWAEAGVPPGELAAMRRGLDLGVQFAESLPAGAVVETIDEGDCMTLGGVAWRVLHTPGHSSSHICLYDPLSRQLIAGDHLLLTISSNPLIEPPVGAQPRARSLLDYTASLRRVADMDVSVAWTGHGAPVYDHRALVAERLARGRERTAYVARLLADGPHTPYQLSERLFPGLPASELFLGISEVVGHLDVLEAEGQVQAWHASGAVHYALVDKQRDA